jgi:hypothetical protein
LFRHCFNIRSVSGLDLVSDISGVPFIVHPVNGSAPVGATLGVFFFDAIFRESLFFAANNTGDSNSSRAVPAGIRAEASPFRTSGVDGEWFVAGLASFSNPSRKRTTSRRAKCAFIRMTSFYFKLLLAVWASLSDAVFCAFPRTVFTARTIERGIQFPASLTPHFLSRFQSTFARAIAFVLGVGRFNVNYFTAASASNWSQCVMAGFGTFKSAHIYALYHEEGTRRSTVLKGVRL